MTDCKPDWSDTGANQMSTHTSRAILCRGTSCVPAGSVNQVCRHHLISMLVPVIPVEHSSIV